MLAAAGASGRRLTKLIVGLVSTVVSAIGWWVGARVGIMTAFFVSMLGLGIGIYLGAKLARHLRP